MGRKNKKLNKSAPITHELTPLYKYGAIIGLVWGTLLLLRYINIHPIPGLEILSRLLPVSLVPTPTVVFENLKSLLIWIPMILGALGYGYLVLQRWFKEGASREFLLSMVLGLGILSTLIFLLGVVQLYHTLTFWGLWLLGVAVFLISWSRGLNTLVQNTKTELWEWISDTPFFFSVMVFITVLIPFLLAFVPEIFYDAMVYHLGVPRWYLNEGGIGDFPNLHARFPLNIQMLYMFGMAVDGESVAKLFHWFMGVLVMWTFAMWGTQLKLQKVGAIAGLIFLTMPMTQMNWWTSGIDLGCSLLVLMSVFCWAQSIENRDQSMRWLVLSGVFAGLGVASKYTCGIVIPVLLLVHISFVLVREKDIKRAIIESVVLGGVATLVFLPWMIRNFLFVGNPIYPFLSQVLGSEPLDADKYRAFYGQNKGYTPTNIKEFLMMPWVLSIKNLSSLNYPGIIPWALLPFSSWVILSNKDNKNLRWIWAVAILSVIIVCYVNRLLRYSMPFLCVLVFLYGVSYAICRQQRLKWVHLGVASLILISSIVNLMGSFGILHGAYNPAAVLFGQESRDEFLSYTHRGMNPYPATASFRELEKLDPPVKRVLLLGDEKVSQLRVPFITSGVYDYHVYIRWIDEGKTPEGIYNVYEKNDVSHIFVNYAEGQRLAGYGMFDMTDEQYDQFTRFWIQHVRFIKRSHIDEKLFKQKVPIFIYSVLPSVEARKMGVPENVISVIFDDWKFPRRKENWLADRIAYYRGLADKFPNNPFFQSHLNILQSNRMKVLQNQ